VCTVFFTAKRVSVRPKGRDATRKSKISAAWTTRVTWNSISTPTTTKKKKQTKKPLVAVSVKDIRFTCDLVDGSRRCSFSVLTNVLKSETGATRNSADSFIELRDGHIRRRRQFDCCCCCYLIGITRARFSLRSVLASARVVRVLKINRTC